MKLSDFFNPFSSRRDWIVEAIQQDREDCRKRDEAHRKEVESNIKKGLVPYIKKKGIFVSCLDSNLSSYSDAKWLSPKIIEKVNQTLIELKTLKKEYKLKREDHLKEFKRERAEIKTTYKGEIDILESAAKRIIKTGHPYLI